MSSKRRTLRRTVQARSPGPRRLLTAGGLIVGGLGLLFCVHTWLVSPEIKLLIPEDGARWILQRRPFKLSAWGPTQEVVLFRKRITLPAQGETQTITVRALRTCMVYLDRQRIAVFANPNEWKQPHRIESKHLAPGEHTFEIFVENTLGPAALLVDSDALDLRSGPGWDEQVLGEAWQPAMTADDVELPEISGRFESPLRALESSLGWLVPLFFAVWGAVLWTSRQADVRGMPTWWTASGCRWIVIAAWFILSVNNFIKLPSGVGYDLPAHIEYVRFISDRGELPDAQDGLEMFQAPLYYVLSAALYRALTIFVSSETAMTWLRWGPLLCGMAQVEICFRAGQCLFPGRDGWQSLTVLLGGLLPMNVYMSQAVSNEPLSGLLSAVVLLWSWQAMRETDAGRRSRWPWRLGLILGLALLTKMSAVLLVPLVAVVIGITNRDRGWRVVLTAFARCFGLASAISGWYYVRNWLRFGQPFVGNWDPVTGILWWQDPGYRTPWQMASFGRSLFQPIYAAFYSIWDGFFTTLWLDGNLSLMDSGKTRPPWNETFLLAAPWPGLFLSMAIAVGLLRGLHCGDVGLRRSLQLAGASLLLYLAAFFVFCLQLPAYSSSRASYTLGLTPAYAVLCVAGLQLLPQHRVFQSALTAFVVCWSVLVYGAYFVL